MSPPIPSDSFIPAQANVQAILAALRDDYTEDLHYRIEPLETGYHWYGINIYTDYRQTTPVETVQAARTAAVTFFAILHPPVKQSAPFTLAENAV